MTIEPLTNHEEIGQFLREFGEDEIPGESLNVDVLRKGNEIIGCIVREQVEHVGPVYLKPEYRGGTAGALLIRHILRTAKHETHIVAMNEETEKICEQFGFEKVDGSLWIK